MRIAKFIAGSVWLLVALALFIGKTGGYYQVQFFGVGRYFLAPRYGGLTFCCLVFGAVMVVSAWRDRG